MIVNTMRLKDISEICKRMESTYSYEERMCWIERAAAALPRAVSMIEQLRTLFIEADAMRLHRWRQYDEGEKRSWEELTPEERDAMKDVVRGC